MATTTTLGDVTDISCLKTIWESLEDPFDSFKSSWNFNNGKEGFICSFTGIDCWHPNENRVMNIRLNNMGLKGKFPLGLDNCTSLTGLDLSSNDLSGPIPSNVSKLVPYLSTLDLSSNRFSGEIPPRFANCRFLNVLKLDNNRLSGTIPSEIGLCQRLKRFSVADNLLTGPLPGFLTASFSNESYANNPGLCGYPLEPCLERAPKLMGSFKNGFMVGFVAFAASVMTISVSFPLPSVLALLSLLKKPENQKIASTSLLSEQRKRSDQDQAGDVSSTSNGLFPELLHENSKETRMLVKLVSKMSYVDLCEATSSFCDENLVGFGRMWMTYKAILTNGWEIAVKRMFRTSHFEDHFVTELKTLGRLRHQNLVPLLGFCIESEERLLVYKYMSNGTLYDLLHPAGDQTKLVPWPLRVKIAIGIARGLLWLHHSCSPRIAHLDISAKCILLNQDFEPKISNFGEAVLLRSDGTESTWSFSLQSEFWKSSLIKEDVYRFGILLLELLTGKDSTRQTNFSSSGHNNLDQWVTDLSTSSDFLHVIDKSLLGQGFDLDILQILTVAYDCANPFQDRRPTMVEVYETIRSVGKLYGLKVGNQCMETEIKEMEEGY